MKITATTGNQYELKGEQEGLILYDHCSRLGVVSSIHVSACTYLQINLVGKRIYLRTAPDIIKNAEGSICVKTSDLLVFFSESNRKIYVDFGHKRGVLKRISNIKLGDSLSFVYGELTPKGTETKKLRRFSSSHPIESIITT